MNVLFNNAAIQVNKTIEDTTFEEWNREVAVNLGGVFLCSKYFLPRLRETRGNIINMSSVNGYFVEPFCAGYCATKAAIIGLTKAMAIDHGKEGIRVNCICPGYIDAGLAEGYFQAQPDPAAARAAAGKLHALWRIGRPEEVGRVAVFLASDEASFVTGWERTSGAPARLESRPKPARAASERASVLHLKVRGLLRGRLRQFVPRPHRESILAWRLVGADGQAESAHEPTLRVERRIVFLRRNGLFV